MNKPVLLKRVKRLEATGKLFLEEATAIRKELEGGASSSPEKGLNKADAAAKVLANRRKAIN
ncbi:hypothetical protein [Christiangramia sp.]|uniref:hypothetical protein n=1 Tax=Christiangramia sp. TaxID=1931228 RepID=UPI002638661F|nr:hypothetical protein [Christiangramia sp.]